jgi:transposase
MPKKKYLVKLNEDERNKLLDMTRKGKIHARKMKRAQILLKADEGFSDLEIMSAINVSRPSVERTRKRLVEGGLQKALNEDPRPGKKRRLDARGEAQLLATVSTQAPQGYERWTLRLLAGKLVELGVVEAISHETVRRTLKKMM